MGWMLGVALAALALWAAPAWADPTVSITTPAAGTPDYPDTAVPPASYSCTADPSSTLSSCSGVVDGTQPVADGDPLVATPGSHTLTVTATDADNGTATASATYTVSDVAPTVSVTTPAAGNPDYPDNAVPNASFSCTSDPNTTLQSCTATVDGAAVTSGEALPAGVGTHTLVVTATDADGLSTPETVIYTVSGPPTIAISAPAAIGYGAAAVPVAAFACTPDANSALQSCTATVDGSPVSDGGALPTAVGPHTLTVDAADQDGLTSSQSVSYTVNPPPSCQSGGVTTTEGTPVAVSLSCSDSTGAALTYLPAGVTPGHGSIGAIDPGSGQVTYTPAAGFAGTDTFTFYATSSNGESNAATETITVLGPPTAQISSPAPDQIYTVGQAVPASFTCTDAAGAPGIESCAGAGKLNTSTEGPQTYTVVATSKDGETGRATIHYTVIGNDPQVSVTTPVNNAEYLWNEAPAANFSCVAGQHGTLQSCKAAIDGQPVSTGQALNVKVGKHTMTITATDTDGLTTTTTITYTIIVALVPPPPVTITTPAQGARYLLGATVKANYSCLGSGSGPALEDCTGSVPAGKPINTRTLGQHSFSVSATDAGGESTTETVTYTVVKTGNHFVIAQLRLAARGVARLLLRLPGPGAVTVSAQAFNARAGGGAGRAFAYGAARLSTHSAGTLAVSVKPNARGRALLRLSGASPVITVAVTYTPTGGRARQERSSPLRVRPVS